MKPLDKVIAATKKLINLPYNLFNLENYFSILSDYKLNPITVDTKYSQPIKLMSGSNFYSRIVTTNYPQYSERKRKIYIIGKGILFDSGGLDIKTRGMADMTGDKAGMIIAMSVANYLKGNVMAFCPVTTNFIHNSKITPGDEIKIGKKIVKVTNTDAEGRLILAEAITELNASPNDIIITIATLTGAVGYAIGDKATGVFSPNSELIKPYAIASREANELAWALPLWEYLEEKYYKGKIIENSVKNIKCGATEGAIFIKQFVPNPDNWIHLDVASSSFNQNGKANGVPIKSLINFIKKLQ
jgi:leucyl aminopeptidase